MINRKLSKVLAAGVGKFIQVLTLPQDVVSDIKDNMWNICFFKNRRRQIFIKQGFWLETCIWPQTDVKKGFVQTTFSHSCMKSATCKCFYCVWMKCVHAYMKIPYSPIAFDERVTFGFKTPCHCLVHVRVMHCICMRLRNDYARASHENNAANAHAQGSDLTCWGHKLLSRQRQSD